MSILIFLAVLFVLVLVHEWGHFVVAKKTDMRVDEFGIGFPPKLFGIKRGETEYTFNLLPIGGFVKIFGEDSVGVEGKEDGARSFVSKSKWAQAAVLVAGVTMNVLFAWLLFSIALGIGIRTAVSEDQATESATLVVTEILQGSPAEGAGIAEGASIISVTAQGENLTDLSPSSFSAFTESHSNDTIAITYSRGDEISVVTVQPQQGLLPDRPEQPAIGVGLTLVEVVSRPIHEAIMQGFTLTLSSLKDITLGIGKLLFDAVRFNADFSQVAGPVGIVGLVGDATAFGATALLMFTAFISLNLAVINLLPFPALDGGRLLFVAIEAIKGSPIRPKYVHILNTVGFLLLILLMIAVTLNDIARII